MQPSGSATRWLLGGLGLLSVLIAVVAMGVLATRVLSDSEPQVRAFSAELPSADVPASLPARPEESVPVDARTFERCRIEQKTLELAAQAYEAVHSTPPPDQEALVDAEMLSAPAESHRLSLVDGEVRIEGLGPCAGVDARAGATTTTWGS